MITERFPVKSAALQFYELFSWVGTVQGLRLRAKQKIEIQNPISQIERWGFCNPKN
jgi:hypothetical protein